MQNSSETLFSDKWCIVPCKVLHVTHSPVEAVTSVNFSLKMHSFRKGYFKNPTSIDLRTNLGSMFVKNYMFSIPFSIKSNLNSVFKRKWKQDFRKPSFSKYPQLEKVFVYTWGNWNLWILDIFFTQVVRSRKRKKNEFYRWPFDLPANLHKPFC